MTNEGLLDAMGEIAIRKFGKACSQAVDSEFRIGGFLCILFLALYPFLFRQPAAGVFFLLEPDALDRIVAEDRDGGRPLAKFILAVDAGNGLERLTLGQRSHATPQVLDRLGHSARRDNDGDKAEF
jgi:hypothetical protein